MSVFIIITFKLKPILIFLIILLQLKASKIITFISHQAKIPNIITPVSYIEVNKYNNKCIKIKSKQGWKLPFDNPIG